MGTHTVRIDYLGSATYAADSDAHNVDVVQCTADADCGTQKCVSNVCRACNPLISVYPNAGCAEPTPYCTTSYTCVQCTQKSHCISSPNGNICLKDVCRCSTVGATTAECLAGRVCASTKYCVAGDCATDANCALPTKFCVSNYCKECKTNADCGTKVCKSNACAYCSADADCGSGMICYASCKTCASICVTANVCGNGRCEPGAGESTATCCTDCPSCTAPQICCPKTKKCASLCL